VDEFQRVVRARIEDAIAHAAELGTEREKALRYYKGDVSQDLPTIEGRSRVVSMDVRDTVMEIMPSLMRIFFGQGKSVEFQPTGIEDEAAASQATDYCHYLFTKKNNGWGVTWDAFLNALRSRSGPVKVWWDKSKRVEVARYENVDANEFALHVEQAQAKGAEIVDAAPGETEGTVSFTVRQIKTNEGMRVEAMPPEELIYSPNATNLERPLLIGQHTSKTVGELVAMGYDKEECLALAAEPDESVEDEARRYEIGSDEDDGGDPLAKEVEYVEAYTLYDLDGDDIPEYVKVCCLGPAHKVKSQEPVSDHPFANYVPFPEPHTPEGQSYFDLLRDLQLIRSQLLRLGLDGLSSVITPRMAYRPTVDLKALMDARPGGLVRVQNPDDITPLQTDKAAPQLAMQAYEQIGGIRQARTGQNAASAGLSPDILQNTTRIEANAVVQRAQSAVELLVRMFAECHRRVFKLLLKGATQYQNKEEVIRLRGQWVPMDPRSWNPDMDVTANVGLGNGNTEERVMAAQMGVQVLQQIMTQAGPVNPWTDAEKVRNALSDLFEANGKNPERYLLTAEAWQQIQQQQAQQPKEPPPPDPIVQAAEIEARGKLEADRYKTDRDHDFKRDQLIVEAVKEAIAQGATPDLALQWGQVISQMISAPRADAGTQMQGPT